MRLNNIRTPQYKGTWELPEGVDLEQAHSCKHDQQALLDLVQPQFNLNLTSELGLKEATYKELAQLIDGNFLNQKARADALSKVDFGEFQDDTVVFYVPSSEFKENGIRYINQVQFDQWDQLGRDEDFDYNEKSRMLLWVGDIRVSCSCPSYLYWGYQYILTVLDSAIYPETRFPKVRNPQERGIVCKHLNRVLRVLPFYSGRIAKEMQRQFG